MAFGDDWLTQQCKNLPLQQPPSKHITNTIVQEDTAPSTSEKKKEGSGFMRLYNRSDSVRLPEKAPAAA